MQYLNLNTEDGQKELNQQIDFVIQCLSHAYEDGFFGPDYHIERMRNNKCHVFLAPGEPDSEFGIIGVSYIKQNCRRGAIATHRNYRRSGVAKKLVDASTKIIPNQYSIIASGNLQITKLLLGCNFDTVRSIDELAEVTHNEFSQFSNFRYEDGVFVFDRTSTTRNATKSSVKCLVHRSTTA